VEREKRERETNITREWEREKMRERRKKEL
jgi:hypothetical protein